MTRTLLTLLPSFPLDRAGGALRSVNTAARFLAASGWRSLCLGTFATDLTRAASAPSIDAVLADLSLFPILTRHAGQRVLTFTLAGVHYTLLDTGPHTTVTWQQDPTLRTAFDSLLADLLATAQPDLIQTHGSNPHERARQQACRAAGARVVLSVRTHNYYHRGAYETVDAVLTCSRFLSDELLRRIRVRSTPLPLPIDLEDVIAPAREPVFITFVNPQRAKGVMFFARLAHDLATRRPDLPLLVVESRGTAGHLAAAARAGGFDLTSHASLMVSPGVALPRDLYAPTRILLVPSLYAEPAGRVIVEAMLNGVVPLLSDRGGMAETARGAGFVLPLPADLTPDSPAPPPAGSADAWLDLIIRLCDDDTFYTHHAARAREIAQSYHPAALTPQFAAYFESVLAHPADHTPLLPET